MESKEHARKEVKNKNKNYVCQPENTQQHERKLRFKILLKIGHFNEVTNKIIILNNATQILLIYELKKLMSIIIVYWRQLLSLYNN